MVKTTGRRAETVGLASIVALALVGAPGCGGAIYAVTAASASSKLEEARAMGAERLAPYEYTYARAHLDKAMEEAAAADYGDAIDFASAAEESADKAIALARQARAGAGR